jgi:LuxR family maltose regulon positive regulatory protein
MASGNLLMLALSAFSLSITQVMQGHLSRGIDVLQDGQRRMRELSPPWRESPTPGVALIEQGIAHIYLERYDLEATRRHIETSIKLAERWGNAEVLTDSRLILNRLCQIEGKMTEAARAIDSIYRMARVREDALSQLTIRQVDAYAARHCLAQGNLAEAKHWANQYLDDEKAREPVDLPGVDIFVIAIEISTLARISIAEGDYRRALRRLTPMLQRLEAAGWMGIAIEFLILQALAFRGMGDLPAAMTALDRALTLGQPEGYLYAFVNPGRPMVNLLQDARAEGRHVAYIDRLLKVLEQRLPSVDERRPDPEAVPLI